RVHRRHGRPDLGQVQRPASNQRWCSDIFLIPCWSGEVLSVAFAIDYQDREVFALTASPRPLNGGDIRRSWTRRSGRASAKPCPRRRTRSSGSPTTALSTPPRPPFSTLTSWVWSRSR